MCGALYATQQTHGELCFAIHSLAELVICVVTYSVE